GSGHDSLSTRGTAIFARRESRGWTRRRDDERRRSGRARNAEADFDTASSARKCRFRNARARAGRIRTQRRMRGARGRSDRRGDGRAGAGVGDARKIRRRFAGRNALQLSTLLGAGKEFLMIYPIVKYGQPVLE